MLAQSDTRTFFELAPLLPMGQWWQSVLLFIIVLVVAGLSVLIYRRDTFALPKPISVALLSLRLMALLGLLIFFLGPEKRSEERIVKPSRLAVLIDTSLSMGLSDESSDSPDSRRIDSVIELMKDSPLLSELSQQHQLNLFRFGDTSRPELIVQVEKTQPAMVAESGDTRLQESDGSIKASRNVGLLGQISVALAALCLIATVVLKVASSGAGSWTMAGGSLLLAVGVLVLAVADLLASQLPLPVSLGWRSVDAYTNAAEEEVAAPRTSVTTDLTTVTWSEELAPRGIATRLGSAVEHIVKTSRGSALAGIVLLTDGRNNQGTAPSRAIAAASDSNIPIYVVGIGSNQPTRNIRVSEIEAPIRVFPDDRFFIKAILQSYGFQGETARVRLSSTNEDAPGTPVTEDERSIQVAADGEPMSVKFEMTQKNEGRRRYFIHVDALEGDLDATDNSQSAVVQVLLQKTKVLLIAGGPTRDYQFLRNQLFRDDDVQLDVWLQMALPGADQESDQMLFDFPETAKQLDEYDCIVAFDADWRRLTYEQTRILERWVSEKAGGLLLIAGPVYTPEWTRRPRGEQSIDLIRGLYPVSFYSQGSATLKLGRFGGKQPFPVDFTREGRTAKHLWLGESNAAESIATWDSFDGVFGFYAVNEPKAGAEILARFSDPQAAIEGELPIYMASQYYGSGRVFFQGSGEIWRLRTINVNYFQSYYLNLIRWVSEGRLLRDSTRGVLLLDRNRCWVGDQLTVRAILRDSADQPLMQPHIDVTVRRPDGVSQQVRLVNIQDAARPGSFTGQFVTAAEGNYEVLLSIPNSPDSQPLSGQVRAAIPDLEKINPERHDALLQEIADRTGGRYFYDLDSQGEVKYQLIDNKGSRVEQINLARNDGLSQMIGVVDQETFLPGSPDELFTRKFSRWLLLWLVLVLCTEWTVRRLHKLA